MQFEFVDLDLYGRTVILAKARSLEDLAADLRVVSQHFVLAVAANTTTVAGPALVDMAGQLIRRGASYVCCWGPDCSRLHDCFDEADFVVNGESTDDRVLMTTWHNDDYLEEMFGFALESTVPSPDYFASTRAVVIATIGNADWASRAKQYLASRARSRNES